MSFNETIIDDEDWLDKSDITWDAHLRVDMDMVAANYNITWWQMRLFKVGEGQDFVKEKVEDKMDAFMDDLLAKSAVDAMTDQSKQEPSLEWIPQVQNITTGEAVCSGSIDDKHGARRRMLKEQKTQ